MLNLSSLKKPAGLLAAIFVVLCFSPGIIAAGDPVSDAGEGVPDVFVYSDTTETVPYTLLVDKQKQQLIVYENRGNDIVEKCRYRCSTGKVPGPKERSGDKKTPEGVYFIINRFLAKDLSPVYGTRAFPLDYPNLIDNMAGRTGYSIWMHGTNEPLKNRNSNGCIVLENSSIEQVEQYIVLNRTPVIVVPHLSFQDRETVDGGKTKISGFLNAWNKALETGSRSDFMRLYNPSALAGVSRWWYDWAKVNKKFSARLTPLSTEMTQIAVYRHPDGYVALFDQILEAPDSGGPMPTGTRKLFFKSVNDRFQIVGDTYLPGGEKSASDSVDPFVETFRKLAKTLVPISDVG